MKHLLFIIVLGITIGCDEPTDYFEENNSNPNLSISKIDVVEFHSHIQDTVKLSLNSSISFYYRYGDDQAGELTKEVLFLSGSGDHTFTDSIITLVPDLGESTIEVKVLDAYNSYATAKIDLYAFNNLSPIADFTYNYNNTLFFIDASNSYDLDALYGGTIVQYEYQFVGMSTIYSDKPTLSQTITIDDIVELRVRVQDNDGIWSESSNVFINP